MLPHHPATFENEAKVNWRCEPRSPRHFSSARRWCSDRTMRFSLPSSGSSFGPRSAVEKQDPLKTVSHVNNTALCSNARVARVMSQLMPRSPNCRIAFSR